ncbi:MAG TPA: AmmeMemoRadiSam system protein A [bacterium]|nr:AmmeMemoRadiSam system protein A [bacterium]
MEQNYYTKGEQEFLLKIARTALEHQLRRGEKFEPQTVNQKLWEKRGCFVTLRRQGELRGCIGLLEPVEALLLAIRDNTLAAARDPRFTPVEEFELDDLKIEVSILTPLEKISLADIKAGDGIAIRRGINSATFLPQVWAELPKKDDFLAALCQKAGLDYRQCQDEEMEFFRYQAIIFFEN